MNIDDMILVSIDDHVVEPPRHVRAARPGEVGRSGSQARGHRGCIDQWMYRGTSAGMSAGRLTHVKDDVTVVMVQTYND